MTNILLSFIVSFGVGVAVAPFVIWLMKKEKAKQTILHYVEAHAAKQGTPTMGGVIFLFAISVSCAIFLRGDVRLSLVSIAVTFAYALLGFFDDFVKIKHKQNLGLRPWQKIVFQVVVSALVAVFVYLSADVGTSIEIPFLHKRVNLSWGIIPFTIFVFLACTNAVNLTDGLDGLASLTTFICLILFVALILLQSFGTKAALVAAKGTEMYSLIIFSVAACGGLLAFLCFNAFPARIFMGDTGSMALGAVVACVGIFSKNSLFILFFGIMYVASAVSVVLQVAYYKKTKKRIFLMAPLHHHFEKKGVHETKIVAIYGIVTLVLGIVTLLFEFIGR